MGSDSKIFVAGHKGLVGSAIVRHLEAEGFTNIITVDRSQCDLTNENAVKMFFMMEQPEYVFLAAAKVGGINFLVILRERVLLMAVILIKMGLSMMEALGGGIG